MQSLKPAIIRPAPAGSHAAPHCAALLLETVPRIMRVMRTFVGQQEAASLTVPQFRTLLYVESHAGASLSDSAEFLGLTLPSASKQVDQLVRRGLLEREHHPDDRRRITLRLTAKGQALLKLVQGIVRQQLAGMLDRFTQTELTVLERALELLQAVFPPLGAASGPNT